MGREAESMPEVLRKTAGADEKRRRKSLRLKVAATVAACILLAAFLALSMLPADTELPAQGAVMMPDGEKTGGYVPAANRLFAGHGGDTAVPEGKKQYRIKITK